MTWYFRALDPLVSSLYTLYTILERHLPPLSLSIFSLTHTLSLQLCGEAMWLIRYKAADEDSPTVTFELYRTMKEISNLTQHVKDER